MPFTPSRRTFMSVFTSLAGVAAVQSPAVAAQAPTAPTDLAWLDGFRGRHKQVYDFGGFDLTDPLPPLRYPRTFLNSVRDSARLELPEVDRAVGISAPAFPMNSSDRVLHEYGLGERNMIIEATTKKPAVRNVFHVGGVFSV